MEMTIRERVLKGLECCTSYDKCSECPYEEFKDPYAVVCQDQMHQHALALLKEQGKSSCDGCECKGSEDCPLDHVSDGNVVCPNGKLSSKGGK